MKQLKYRFWSYMLIFLNIVIFGSIGFMFVEKTSFTDALYFTFVTVSTVGYGDIYPLSDIGKMVSVLLIILGVGTFLGVVASATEIMLHRREKEMRIDKLHMVIGVFFSEVGINLLAIFSSFDPQVQGIRSHFLIKSDWNEENFNALSCLLANYEFGVDRRQVIFENLRSPLIAKRNFMVGLLQNPTLLEHELFTDLLQAVFHLTEELSCRGDFADLPDTDIEHLEKDITRAYSLLVGEWIIYMRYLKDNYPFLFSFAMRTNPFDSNPASVVIAG